MTILLLARSSLALVAMLRAERVKGPMEGANATAAGAEMVRAVLAKRVFGAARSSVPALTVVPPVKVFEALSVSVPIPLLSSDPPGPVMFPAKFVVRGEETVNWAAPRVMEEPGAPLRAPMVWLTALRLSAAPAAIVTGDCEGSTEVVGAGLGESEV